MIVATAGVIIYDRSTNDPRTASAAVRDADAVHSANNFLGRRPDFRLADTEGRVRQMSEWDGTITVVNFWATWCAPCLQEMPAFVELQNLYGDKGVQFVGIALDTPSAVARFGKKLGINYPLLVGAAEAIAAAAEFGNALGVLPYTAVVDRDGALVHRQAGIYPRDQLEDLLQLILATEGGAKNIQ